MVYWRSLRNALPVEEWLAGAIAALSAGRAVVPAGLDAQLGLLLDLLRGPRALLVLDNLEAVLAPEASEVCYRTGYEGYGTLLRRLAEGVHEGCLLLTSREQPLPADDETVRALRPGGLSVDASRTLPGSRALLGDETSWRTLTTRYGGNPLALHVVGETIDAVFDGDIAAFLAQEAHVFGGIRQLLDEQIERLSTLEHEVLTWLAVEREPVNFADLTADLGPGTARTDVVEAVAALRRRSLLEQGEHGAFTLQPVVLEYITERLVDAVAREILAGRPERLVSQALLKATAKDYVRRSQERLIARPILDQLLAGLGDEEAVQRRLRALLEAWRGQSSVKQGYGPGNALNLLRLPREDLRGLDLSGLVFRHAFLQQAQARDASLAGAHLSEPALAEAFNFLTSVALSAAGEYLAAGTDTGDVCLWRVADRTLLLAVRGHSSPVADVALSADGRLVASGSFDGTVKLWEAATGRLLGTLEGHAGAVWGVALSGDGRLVAGGSFDGTIRLWEAATGQLLTTFRGHTGTVWGVTLSGDGRLLASGSLDGTARLWDAASGRLLATLEGHAGAVRGVALSEDGRLVATGSVDGTVRLWEATDGQLSATLQGHAAGVEGVALSADGRLVASAGQDGTARLWDAASGRQSAILQGYASAVPSVALSRAGRLAATGSVDGMVRLWEPASGRLLFTLQGHTGTVWGVALSDDGRLVAGSGVDGTVRLWETASGRPLHTLRGHAGTVWGVALSGAGRFVVSGGFDGTVRVWEAESGRLLHTLEGHTRGVEGVALSGDDRLVAGGSQDGTVKLWEAASGRLLVTLQGHTAGVLDVALSGDGRLVASGSFDGTVKLWDAPSGRLLTTLQGHTAGVLSVALSEDGRLVAGSSYDGTAKLWDVASGACLRTVRSDRRYERMDITGLTGVTEAQRMTLLSLGAIDHGLAHDPRNTLVGTEDASFPIVPAASVPAEQAIAPPDPARPPTNLPPARTSFVGRVPELAALVETLNPITHPDQRVVTLVGPAGCGKTRLALAAAEAARDTYDAGVRLVELAPLPASLEADPTPPAAAALAALGIYEQPGRSALDTLVAYLRDKRLLLLIDNCEHVPVACALLIARLTAACPDLRILATSQLALGIATETVQPVNPLSAPAPVADKPSPEMIALLGQSDAVRLFVERARAVQPRFKLTAETAETVAAICRQLDGLPLAIELAAARLNVLPLEDILVRLHDRFRLLRSGGQMTIHRHQTLQATMDWSYGLLEPAEQAVLCRLAVFSGGWELAAAEAMCADEEPAADTVLIRLDELTARSLIHITIVHGAPRYGMLETVRQYALRRLEQTGEAEAARDRRLDWYVALVEQAVPELAGPKQAVWLARLEREQDNLRSCLRWALDRNQSTLGLRLAGGLGKFWLRGGHQREGRHWLSVLLAPAHDSRDAAAVAVRVTALLAAAGLAEDAHDFAQATAFYAESEALRLALGHEEHLAGQLLNAALEARAGGEYARATVLLEECLAQYRRRGNPQSPIDDDLGLSLSFAYRFTFLALILREQGEFESAIALCEECLALARNLEDTEGVGQALLSLADVARDRGDTARLRAYGEESLALFRALGHPYAVGFALHNLALAAYLEGDLEQAANRAAESEGIFRELQSGSSIAEVLVTVGRVKGAMGDAAVARACLTEALNLAWVTGPRLVVVAVVEELGIQGIRQGKLRHGVELLGSAAALRRTMGAPVRPADRRAIEDALATARASLGAAVFADLWATGEALPVDQMVARAVAIPMDDAGVPGNTI